MKTVLQLGVTILRILLLFLSALAPLMFLVGMIAGLDRAGAQRRLLENLETYGKTTEATVIYVDDEDGRAGVDYVRPNGQEGFGTLDLRYYTSEVRASIQPGVTVRIIYIDALISEGEKTVLAEHYADVEAYPLVEPEIWGVLLVSWLIIMIHPQFVFLGMVDGELLMKLALPEMR